MEKICDNNGLFNEQPHVLQEYIRNAYTFLSEDYEKQVHNMVGLRKADMAAKMVTVSIIGVLMFGVTMTGIKAVALVCLMGIIYVRVSIPLMGAISIITEEMPENADIIFYPISTLMGCGLALYMLNMILTRYTLNGLKMTLLAFIFDCSLILIQRRIDRLSVMTAYFKYRGENFIIEQNDIDQFIDGDTYTDPMTDIKMDFR